MHKYLRAIGFSDIKKRSELDKILKDVIQDPGERQYVSTTGDTIAVEFRKEYADLLGIAVCGTYTEDAEFEYEYYYPYIIGQNVSSAEEISIERHIEKESYAGLCDDLKVGVSLIFYLQNRMDYLKFKNGGMKPETHASVNFAAMSTEGAVVLPLMKDPVRVIAGKDREENRHHLLAAAREGDEEAIDDLTMEDIDTYTAISKRIRTDDILSLVDTYFMPWGIECDLYSVLGEIVEGHLMHNSLTKEGIYVITVKCNDMTLDVCINEKDLTGEPAPGRRFKGIIWLQGHVNFTA
ncbi:MAG: DUF3881 family protein [Lachnospiraceae bacterium]|nr:DUF3881 family protein [Lachnospiraceae bacterium]